MGVDINDLNFKEQVLEDNLPVLVDFWAVWCGPCLRLAPLIEKIAREYTGRLKICKLNIDEAPKTTSQYDILGIPTLLIFKNRKIMDRITGIPSEEELRGIIEKYI